LESFIIYAVLIILYIAIALIMLNINLSK